VGSATASGVPSKFALVRYNDDGSLDTTFANGGVITKSIGTRGGAQTVVRRADGRLIASGAATSPGQDTDVKIVQYWP
jgi:hypothetical protein